MEIEARVREITTAFLDAQRERIVEELSERLKPSGSTALLPLHCALFDLAATYIRDPSSLRLVGAIYKTLAGAEFRPDIQSLISGQIVLWSVLHRMLREVTGPHSSIDVIHAALALTGDTVDGIIGILIDIAATEATDKTGATEATEATDKATDKRMGSGGASVAAGGESVAWGTLVELGRTHREFQMLHQVIHDLLNAHDPLQMFELLEEGILGAFHLRSLTIAVVNDREKFVEVVRSYPASSGARDPVGWRFDLSHPDILCDVAHTGRTEVIDGWDLRYHERVVQADGSVIFCQPPRDYNAGHTAFFVPILARDRTIGVVCTGSTQASKQIVLREIERMRPFLHQVGATLSSVSEVIERKRAEEALRIERDHSAVIINGTPAMVCGIAPEGTTIFVNPACERITGYRADELVGRNWWQTFYPGDEYRQVEQLLRDFERGDVRDHEMVLTTRTGQKRTISWNSINRFDEAGRLIEVIGFGNDVTERKQLEEQLRQSQKMEAVGRLAGGIAHDFNNMLQVIAGYCELLLTRPAQGGLPRKEIEEIKNAGERATSLTRQLLVFSRRQVLEPKVLDLNTVVSNMGQMLRRLIGEDVELVTILRPGLGHVKADPGQIEQVIMNLVVNARDAMPQGGRLTIETENLDLDEAYAREHLDARPGPYVMLSVTDTGSGMDAETRSHLFEPFFTTKEKGKGTGLGLATVYGIVTQSGGSISVSSEPGQGSTFRIYLPRTEEAVETAHLDESLAGLPQGTETVLLVEDEEAVRNLVREILRRCGYTVLEAADGAEAIQASERHEGLIHLMVADVVMPQMNGLELAQHLKSKRPGMKVLYISGYTDDEVVRHGILETDKAFLPKPFKADALARKVREVIDE